MNKDMTNITSHIINNDCGRKKFFDFVRSHISEDASALRLKYHRRDTEGFYAYAITQIECRHRFGTKLAETLEHFDEFLFADTLQGEQATSDRMARFHSRIIGDCPSLTDLTAGLGIDALHAAELCRDITACELEPSRAEVLRYNVAGMGYGDVIKVITGDSTKALREGKLSGDTVFADPARRSTDGERVFAIEDCQPDLVALSPLIARHFNRLIAKLSPMLDVSAVMHSLQGIRDIYVIATPTECRELLLVSQTKSDNSMTPNIHAVTLGAYGDENFSFTITEEASAQPTYATPVVGQWLVLPFPAVVKAGAFKLFATRHNLEKLAPNTHVYFGDTAGSGISGQVLEIIDIVPWQSKNIKRLHRQIDRAWVSCRNFPMAAAALQKKLSIKPGGELRLIAMTDRDKNPLLVVAKPIN